MASHFELAAVGDGGENAALDYVELRPNRD
jgi:hypothetical protein